MLVANRQEHITRAIQAAEATCRRSSASSPAIRASTACAGLGRRPRAAVPAPLIYSTPGQLALRCAARDLHPCRDRALMAAALISCHAGLPMIAPMPKRCANSSPRACTHQRPS
jgi:hypothetical protein